MICFLTSRIDLPGADCMLNPANRFVDELRRHFPDPCRALYICSDPGGWEETDVYAAAVKKSFENSGFSFRLFRTLDGRNELEAAELIALSNLLILSGGHVPTQNRFFRKIRLRALMQGFDGVVIGISAGSMNGADIVYAQPEREGEASDPRYQRFLPGLSLTKTMLLPHYQETKYDVLDGMRLYEDITFSDSKGTAFYAIPDGSYLFICAGNEELRGEAYRIKDGGIAQICAENGRVSPDCGSRFSASGRKRHDMKLDPAPYAMIKSGEKTIELRLFDEKRRQIKPGDEIVFANAAAGETLHATVVRLHRFRCFAELYRALPLVRCGYTDETVDQADPADMERYYPKEKQNSCGVVGIEFVLHEETEGNLALTSGAQDGGGQAARITAYEKKLDEAAMLLRTGRMSERLAELAGALAAYYHSPLWKQDYADDEAGLIPRDLKRGVLSEDGIYLLLEICRELSEKDGWEKLF